MAEKRFHVVKQESGWAVRPPGATRAASVHETQAEALAAARRSALKRGGAEVVVHRADGRIREVDAVGAAAIDVERRSRTSSSPARAPRSEGPRTTLRVPAALAETADRLAHELEISRNDALLRLATRGAQLYEAQERIAARRDARWAAVVPGVVDVESADLPSAEEARSAIFGDPAAPR